MKPSNAEGMPVFSSEPESSVEKKDNYLPLINDDEVRFIENVGGEYQGFVDRLDGKQEFQDVQIGHCAYYDKGRRSVVEAFISTEAVNDEGGNELGGPSEVKGYVTMIVYRSPSGETLDKPPFIALPPENHPDGSKNLSEARRVAHLAHRYLLENVSHLSPSELETQVNALFAKNQKKD